MWRAEEFIVKLYRGTTKFGEISTLTYNVCWGCMSGTGNKGSAANYGARCKNSRCLNNLVNVCAHHARDFIGLQETSLQVNNLIQKKMPSMKCVTYNYVSILFDSKFWEQKGSAITGYITDDNGTQHPGREYLGCVFFNPTTLCVCAVVNMHGPHSMFSRTNIVKMLLDKNKHICINHVFVMGDFNNELLSQKTINIDTFVIQCSNKYKTGWNLNGNGGTNAYTKCVDNILGTPAQWTSETWHNSSGKLLPKEYTGKFHYANNTSDHSPVATLWQL